MTAPILDAQIEAAARSIDPEAWDHHDRLVALIATAHGRGVDLSDALAPADCTKRSLDVARRALAAAAAVGRPS